MRWEVTPWSAKTVMPEPWCREYDPLDMISSVGMEALVGVPFQIINCDTEALAAQVRDALNAASATESIRSHGYDVGMCNDTDQSPLPGLDDPFDGVAVRPIPGNLSDLLTAWADDIAAAAVARHDKSLRPRAVRAINAGLGEQRTVYGIVSVLEDGLSSVGATLKLIEDRIARVEADEQAADAAGDRKLRRVHSARAMTLNALLVELRVSLAGGGFAVGVPVSAAA